MRPPGQAPYTVAILQNQWFKDPVRARATYQNAASLGVARESLDATFLFMGCLTGKRLKVAFGDDIDEIVWSNVSPEIGGESSAVFPADPVHIMDVLSRYSPTVLVLAFGKVAGRAMPEVLKGFPELKRPRLLVGPHPAARHFGVVQELKDMAARYRELRKTW